MYEKQKWNFHFHLRQPDRYRFFPEFIYQLLENKLKIYKYEVSNDGLFYGFDIFYEASVRLQQW